VTAMAALTADINRPGATADLGPGGPPAARTTGPAGADRSIAQKTGFGLVSPLPGILPSLHLDTFITLPVGVEAYAAYALRAWLSAEPSISGRTRPFAKWSAICSFAFGMAGQVAYLVHPREVMGCLDVAEALGDPAVHAHSDQKRCRFHLACQTFSGWTHAGMPRSTVVGTAGRPVDLGPGRRAH
jgi:hypothetical protein